MERDISSRITSVSSFDFNSHAHVERDQKRKLVKSCIRISTHTLTWSVTIIVRGLSRRLSISTHTLTWSVTFFDYIDYLC